MQNDFNNKNQYKNQTHKNKYDYYNHKPKNHSNSKNTYYNHQDDYLVKPYHNPKENNDEKDNKKRIIIYIAIIILLLLLLTSCTSNFWGTIGSLFKNEGNYNIDPDTNDKTEILNQELKFDMDELEISLSDVTPKISYTSRNLRLSGLTCSTSDANMATCYAEDGYVVINPKAAGKVTIYLQGNANGKVYKASSKVTITDSERFIRLSSTKGTINLDYNYKKYISYSLVGLTGRVSVSSSDEEVAIATLENNTIKIKGFKPGVAKITVSVTYNGTEYTSVYTVKVIGKSSSAGTTSKPNSSNKPNGGASSGSIIGDDNKPKPSDPTTSPTSSPKPTDSPKPTIEPSPSTSPTPTPTPTIDPTPTPTIDPSPSPTPTDTPVDPTQKNYLQDIQFGNGLKLDNFDKETFKYVMNVGYDTSSLTFIKATAEDEENTTISYKLNGNTFGPGSELSLGQGANPIEITVTSKDGQTSTTYTVIVYKPTRKIEVNSSHTIGIEEPYYDLEYTVYESVYNKDTDEETFETIVNFALSDISFTLTDQAGTDYSSIAELLNGIIRIKPDKNTDLLKSPLELTVRYDKAGSKSKSTLTFKVQEYRLPAVYQNGVYPIEFRYNTGYKNLTLSGTNFFTGNLVAEELKDDAGNKIGIRIKEEIDGVVNNDVYIDVTTENPDVIDLLLEKSDTTSSVVVKAQALKAGKAKVTIKGYAYNTLINSFDVELNVTETYKILIRANGGFYNDGITEYTYLVPSILPNDAIIRLSDKKYKAYRVEKDASGNCIYYKLVSYNTDKDGKGTEYPLDRIITTTNSDLTLYAQWEVGTDDDKPVIEKKLYLPDFNLFHNEAYFQKYNEDKVIYPGAEGSYVMTFNNDTPNDVKIVGMTLNEDHTICVEEGCLNMGYRVRFTPKGKENYTYYYGEAGNLYKILHKDTSNIVDGAHEIRFGSGISVAPGEGVEFTLLWKWVDDSKFDFDNANNTSATKSQYDRVDTKIGKKATNANDEYTLTVNLIFENEENYCELD